MKVYRVEHKKKKTSYANCFAGPYGASNIVMCSEWTEREHKAPRNPTPEQDEKLMISIEAKPDYADWEGYFHCGFNSMSQLKAWFSVGELLNLKALGFVIACYNVEEVLDGDTQVLFLPEGRRRITEITEEVF